MTLTITTLGQVMAWCCQTTSHYMSQCWPRSLSPYGVIRPQWVNITKRHSTLALRDKLWSISCEYRKTSNINHTLSGNKIVDHSDVVGALPVSTAPTTPSFLDWATTIRRRDEKHLCFGIWCGLYWRFESNFFLEKLARYQQVWQYITLLLRLLG